MVRKYAVEASGREEFAMESEITSCPREGVAAFKEKRKAHVGRAARV
jgi:hypothetical protein